MFSGGVLWKSTIRKFAKKNKSISELEWQGRFISRINNIISHHAHIS